MRDAVNWFDIQGKIEQKLGLDHRQFRDVMGGCDHFHAWADAKGYTVDMKDPDGCQRDSSQIWYDEYFSDPEGVAKRPPHIDLWHCMLDHVVPEGMCNGSKMWMTPLDEEDFPLWEGSDVKLMWRYKALMAYNEVIAEYLDADGRAYVLFNW